MATTLLWQPEATCSCRVRFNEFSTTGLVRYEVKCAAHARLSDVDAWDALRVENVSQAGTVAALARLDPARFAADDGTPSLAAIDAVVFDQDRKIVVTATLSSKQKQELADALDAAPDVSNAVLSDSVLTPDVG
jgi:hypothetical protein